MDFLLNKMIDVLVLEILDYLPIQEKYENRLVSKRFFEYTKEIFYTMTNLGIILKDCDLINDILNHIHDNYRIKYISMHVFRNCTKLVDASLLKLYPNSNNITYISLAECKQITDKSLECISKNCPKLFFLNIESCLLTDKSIFSLVNYNIQLKYLNCSWCKYITKNSLISLFKNSKKLEEINLSGCKINSDVIESLCYIQNLKELVLNWCNNFDNESFNNLINTNFNNLESISLYGCLLIDEINILTLTNKCSKLKKLNLEWSRSLTNQCMINLSSCYYLTELNLSWCNQINHLGIEIFSKFCINVNVLILRSCKKLIMNVFFTL